MAQRLPGGLLFWAVRHLRGQWEAQVLLLRALGLSVWPAPELHLNRFWDPPGGAAKPHGAAAGSGQLGQSEGW